MIELLTLGGYSIRRDGVELSDLSGHKQKIALLSYLALEGPVPRDRLLALFWPEVEERRARNLLSSAIYSLKQRLGADLVEAVGDRVGVARGRVEVDLHEIEAAAQDQRWEDVVRGFGGAFLDQFYLPDAPRFEEWQSRTRAWVSGLARKAFAAVIADRNAAGDAKGALDVAWRWARVQPLEDEAQHALIALLAMSGDRAAALQQFEAFRARLAQELDLDPPEETAQMVEEIRSGAIPRSPLIGEAPPEGTAPSAPESVPARRAFSRADIDRLVREELGPRLQIVRKLGESSTSSVYLARESELPRHVVVKVCSPILASDRRARMRFDREVQAAASLTHPNIATLLWAGSLSNGLPYFVMEYVEGRPLAEKLRVEGRFSNEDARRLLSQLASALASAHRRGIVHRDVQPSNILCDKESGRCLLTDFGIATILSAPEGGSVRITESGELVGDPRWMSPEQLRDDGVTERSDVYALGLVGYELLAEDSPYVATNRSELFAAHMEQPPRKLSELRPDVDPDLEDVLERCLAKEPRSRPSAAQVEEQLSTRQVREREPRRFWERLIWRRVPHWVGAYLAGGFGLVELVETLVALGTLPEVAVVISLATYALGTPVAFVLAWYHGRAGPQPVGRLEASLLAAVVLIWLAVLARYLVL